MAFIDLGADQCTLYYSTATADVLAINGCTNTQGPNFNKALFVDSAQGLRLLPDGGMLIADVLGVVRLDASGRKIQTYTLPVGNGLSALSLDPDGTSFWTSDLNGPVFKVDIASGTVLQNWDASVAPNFNEVGGLSVKGVVQPVLQTCSSTDAALANLTFPATGTLDYDISSPTKVMSSIQLIASTNIASSTSPAIQPGGHSAIGGKFVKADPTKRATFELQVSFTGPLFACNIDPLITTLKIKKGHEASQSFHMIAKAEHFIDVDNGSPGLTSLEVDVNGTFFRTVSLQSGETVHIDASAFMTSAKDNTLTFTGKGKTGTFANIDVSDSAPPPPTATSVHHTSVQERGIWGRLMYEE